jgi:hypothetical protein
MDGLGAVNGLTGEDGSVGMDQRYSRDSNMTNFDG